MLVCTCIFYIIHACVFYGFVAYWKNSTEILLAYIHPFNGPLSGTTWVSRYQKGKTNLEFYWSKRHWVEVASAGPYASLYLAPDR